MKHTILVVDDEKDIVNVIKVRLTAWGYNVLTAFDGQSGVNTAKERRPDLIMLDVMMPVMDGITAYEHLKKESSLAKTPVIFLTALLSKGEEEQLIARLGNPDVYFLAKPFDPVKISELTKKLLNNNPGGEHAGPTH